MEEEHTTLILIIRKSRHIDFRQSKLQIESAGNAGDLGLIPGSGRSSREGNGNPLQYFCLENPMDRGSCSWDHKESGTTERLNNKK